VIRIARAVALLGVCALACYGLAYWLTYEPAPRIRVLWRPEITPARRVALERRYRLVNPRELLPEGSLAYDLLDTSASNVEAMVEDPAIADTHDIERHTHVVRFETDYGNEWMWIADRTPGLRNRAVRRWILTGLILVSAAGLATAFSRSA
jgi:hypothetical protein